MSFSPFNWLRDALGIKHDIVAAKKTNLEITKLKDEQESAQKLVQPVTFEDVKEYDPKYRNIQTKTGVWPEVKSCPAPPMSLRSLLHPFLLPILFMIILFIVAFVLLKYF